MIYSEIKEKYGLQKVYKSFFASQWLTSSHITPCSLTLYLLSRVIKMKVILEIDSISWSCKTRRYIQTLNLCLHMQITLASQNRISNIILFYNIAKVPKMIEKTITRIHCEMKKPNWMGSRSLQVIQRKNNWNLWFGQPMSPRFTNSHFTQSLDINRILYLQKDTERNIQKEFYNKEWQ